MEEEENGEAEKEREKDGGMKHSKDEETENLQKDDN